MPTPSLVLTADVVAAAQAGEPAALAVLSEGTLRLVHSIAARAHSVPHEVDDIVQEAMIRILRGLGGLESPEAYRAWVATITMNQVRDQRRVRAAAPAGEPLDEAAELPDPAAEFEGRSVLGLELSEQRAQTLRAAEWLDGADRDLLPLWWLETAGELSRQDTAAALAVNPHHVAVRVQRMKARLRTARLVVRALAARPRCADLARLAEDWDGVPGGLWRKRLGRHVRDCPGCGRDADGLFEPEGLLAPYALLPVPALLAAWLRLAEGRAAPHGPVAHRAHPAASHGPGVARPAGTPPAAAPRLPSGAAGAAGSAGGKALVAAAALLALGGGLVIGNASWQRPGQGPATASAPPSAAGPGHRSGPAAATPTADPHTASAAPRTPRTTTRHARTAPRYGSVVDAADSAPPPGRAPGGLPRRPERAVWMTGQKRHLDGYQLVHRGDAVVLRGEGYVEVHWDVMYRRPGLLAMPSWTGLTGRLFHVASGGGHRMDDPRPGAPDHGTWMGNRAQGLITLPAGAQQMWQDEYYYLDGSVVLHLNERAADYNLDVLPSSWQAVTADIDTPPGAGGPASERYGLVRDTGRDDAPVPQYLTRSRPSDPGTVPQHSRVG